MSINKRYEKSINETLYTKVLPSGLTIKFIPKKDFSTKFAFFVTKYGSTHNSMKNIETGEIVNMPKGIAHFLEHKLFESTEENAFNIFGDMGAHVNAFTNFFVTVYHFETVDNFYEALKELVNLVQNINLTEESVENEKEIITQEINMYLDNPDWKVYSNCLSAMYNDYSIRDDIAGTEESIRQIDKEKLEHCYKAFYTPKNMELFVIGDLDKDEVFDCVENSLSDEFLSRKQIYEYIILDEDYKVSSPKILEKKDIPVPKFQIGFKHKVIDESWSEKHKRNIAITMVLDMLFGKSSDFYQRVYDNGLITDTIYFDESFGESHSHTIMGGDSKHIDKITKEIIDELKYWLDNPLDEKIFNRIKNKFIGRSMSSFNSIRNTAGMVVSYRIKHMDVFDVLNMERDMDFEYAQKVFKEHFDIENYTISIIE